MRPMSGLRILITNLKLEGWTGTELFARDLARGLLEAGHRPVLYSPRLGKLAAEIRRETVPVVEDLRKLSTTPDIIHGQHANETLTALLHFPRAPALYFCHDWYSGDDYPPRFPRVLRYAAADEQCYDKLVCEFGVPEERARVVCQFVDLERFGPRPPLPARPPPPAVLGNYPKENEHLRAAPEACGRRGVRVGELPGLYEEGIAEYAAAPPDRELEGRAAAAHLREVSVAFWRQREAVFNSTPYRVTERLRRTPVLGRLSRALARGFAGRK